MATETHRRWIILGLVAFGVVVVALLPKRGSDEAVESPDGRPTRRVADGCAPADASAQYEGFVGKRALAILSWDGMSERAANLKIPVNVVRIEDDAVAVRFLQFPMREQYLNIWLGSGHIRPGSEGTFLLEPCSATIVEWPAMERGDSADE